jgi:hypothetical protein
MIEMIRKALSPLLPLHVEVVEYNDPMIVLAGSGWSLSVACPWRLMRDCRLAASYGDDGAGPVLDALVGSHVIDFRSGGSGRGPGDIQLELEGGVVLDVFVDTDLDPWVLRVPDHTFVGTASCG